MEWELSTYDSFSFFLFFNGGTVENKRFQMTNKCHESWKSKVLQDALAKLWSSLFLATRTMQVLFVLRFYHPDKTDKTDKRDFPSLPPPPKKGVATEWCCHQWKAFKSSLQDEVYFMGGGAAGGLWRHQTWSPSWILSRIRNQLHVKTVSEN